MDYTTKKSLANNIKTTATLLALGLIIGGIAFGIYALVCKPGWGWYWGTWRYDSSIWEWSGTGHGEADVKNFFLSLDLIRRAYYRFLLRKVALHCFILLPLSLVSIRYISIYVIRLIKFVKTYADK